MINKVYTGILLYFSFSVSCACTSSMHGPFLLSSRFQIKICFRFFTFLPLWAWFFQLWTALEFSSHSFSLQTSCVSHYIDWAVWAWENYYITALSTPPSRDLVHLGMGQRGWGLCPAGKRAKVEGLAGIASDRYPGEKKPGWARENIPPRMLQAAFWRGLSGPSRFPHLSKVSNFGSASLLLPPPLTLTHWWLQLSLLRQGSPYLLPFLPLANSLQALLSSH